MNYNCSDLLDMRNLHSGLAQGPGKILDFDFDGAK